MQNKWIVTQAAMNFSVSSIVMLLLNKYIATVIPYPAFILLLQNVFTIFFLKIWKTELNLEYKKAVSWAPCVMLFLCNLYSSMKALKYISVPTFSVFRNMQPIMSTMFDLLLRQQPTTYDNMICIMIILIGSYIYAWESINYDAFGYIWTFFFMISSSLYTIAVKVKIDETQLNSFEMSYYNNVLSLVPLLCLTMGEKPSDNFMEVCTDTFTCWLPILISGYGAFFISVAGFQAQEVMTPTTWLVCNNLSKLPAIMLACMLWGMHLTWWQILGIVVSILGGFLYSMSSQKLLPHQVV